MDFEIYALIENKLGCMLSNMDTTLEDDGTVLLTLDGQDFDVGSDFNKIVAFLETRNDLIFDIENYPDGDGCYSWSASISILKN